MSDEGNKPLGAESPEQVVMNGTSEDDRDKMRPADIDADMKEMERRKRVEAIMNSKIFREELEKIIEQQMREGGPGPLLQQISEMMGAATSWRGSMLFRGGSCAIPINDIRGVDTIAYAKGEKLMRCKLAALYRIIDIFGWSQNIYNHITLRVHHDQAHFLINPFGMLYHEITASSLIKVDVQGNVVEPGTTNLGVNIAGFTLHSAIHASRPDLKCIVHLHVPSVVAVSSLKCGLLPVCQEAAIIGDVSYHEYNGILIDASEKDLIIRNLGPFNKVLFLRNHGVVCCGETVEEAFLNTYYTVMACESQMKIMPLGLDNVILMSDEAKKQAFETARHGGGGVNSQEEGVVSTEGKSETKERKERKWRFGEQEFEALMRSLDNSGYRTGYMYRQPLIKSDVPRPKYDVELPPAVSSLGYLLEEEELYKNNPNWKKFMEGRRGFEKTRWLNSPNVYQKVEVLETGTPDPKKITKWVAEGSPTHGTPVKIESTLQFVPKNTDPKEFKKLQQQIKENRRAGGISAGPQSQILEGVSWEEAKQVQDASMSSTGDQVILVGAASKGIIQRNFQHHAVVYKTPYAKNPFDCITNEDIEEYKQEVQRKQRGDGDGPTSLDESTPIVSPVGDTDEDSRDAGRPQVLQIETKQVPRASKPEVVQSDANDLPDPYVARSKSARFPRELESKIRQRRWSGSEKGPGGKSDAAVNGDEEAHPSHDPGSPVKDISTEDSSSKATEKKKKKKGLKTPSFLKKKKDKKKTDES